MQLKRASALLTIAVVAGLGLTACNDGTSATAAGSSAPSTAAAAPTPPPTAASASTTASTAAPAPSTPAAVPASSTPAAPAPAPSGTDVILGGKTKPADLPPGVLLPTGKLTLVNGATGTYIMTFEATGGGYAAYAKALKDAGFEVTDMGTGTSLAEKGDINLLISSSAETITVTYAKI